MQAQGYWVKGNRVIDLTCRSQIGYLYDHPKDFGFSRLEVEETFQRHRERPGKEGTAREELIKRATTQCWIRVRCYVRPGHYWSIQFDSKNEGRL